jgi:hypothetical protein
VAPNGYKAVTRYRDWDGKVRQVKRHGATKGAARRNLAAAIRDRSSGTSQIDINGETKLSVLSEVWFDEIKGRDLSPSTVQAYRDRLDKQILPSLGELRLRELSVGVVDRHLAAVKAAHGAIPGQNHPQCSVGPVHACMPIRRDRHQPMP